MSSVAESTLLTKVKIDVNPEGITFSFEGLPNDLTKLIEAAGTFRVNPVVYRTFDTADISIQSDKALLFVPRAPVLAPSTTAITGQDVTIRFASSCGMWAQKIMRVLVNGIEVSTSSYTVVNDSITFLSSLFPGAGTYDIVIKSDGFMDASVKQIVS